MRILSINKYHYLKSGTERYRFNLIRLLESKGHKITDFSMHHPRNLPSPFENHFLPYIDYEKSSLTGQVQAAFRAIWYPLAARRIGRLLDQFHPDIVHLHNIYHQISPAILPVIQQHNIPIVQTLHDYKLICPNYLLYTQGHTCQLCKDGRYYHAVQNRCLHGSLAWSAAAALEMTLHKRWQVYERHVSRFLAPSHFILERMVAFGIPEQQLALLPRFLFAAEQQPTPAEEGKYALFLGRLSEEKGLITLLTAAQQANVPLYIVGEGPMRTTLEIIIAQDKLTQVRLAGYLAGPALAQAIARARFTVVPSEWYEVFGQIIIESFARGKPVVATAVGGIPEIVDDGVDGLLVPPGDATALAKTLRWLWDRPQVATGMGSAGRVKVEKQYDAPLHYQRILALYQEVAH
jgi:glycosyltransferase involved in cell wall biosynthesis